MVFLTAQENLIFYTRKERRKGVHSEQSQIIGSQIIGDLKRDRKFTQANWMQVFSRQSLSRVVIGFFFTSPTSRFGRVSYSAVTRALRELKQSNQVVNYTLKTPWCRRTQIWDQISKKKKSAPCFCLSLHS